MRFKLFLLAAVAALATAMPARADLVFEWRLASVQPPSAIANPPQEGNTDPTTQGDYSTQVVAGTPIAGNVLNLAAGQTVFLQAVLRQIDNTGPDTFTYVPGAGGDTGGLNGGGLFAYGVRVNNSAPTLATHVQPSANNNNTRGVNVYGFSGAGPTVVNATTGGSNPTVGSSSPFTIFRDVADTDWYQVNGIYPLFNFRFQAPASSPGGTGTLTFVDPSGGADIGSPLNPNMDALIFPGAPVLTFNVAAIPEPSSMVLAGLGLAGLGYRLRRKKVAKEEVAA